MGPKYKWTWVYDSQETFETNYSRKQCFLGYDEHRHRAAVPYKKDPDRDLSSWLSIVFVGPCFRRLFLRAIFGTDARLYSSLRLTELMRFEHQSERMRVYRIS